MTPVQCAYIAGIIDGEGAICIAANNTVSYVPRINVGTVSKSLTDYLLRVFGGKVCPKRQKNPRAKDQWHWYLNGAEAIQLLTEIADYLVIKQLQARLVLAVSRFHSFTGKHARGISWTVQESAQAKEAKATLHRLNVRGRIPAVSALPSST